jgi:hypothetical protein
MFNNWDARANWRLMMAPPEVIDYIIIKTSWPTSANQTDSFWSLVAEYDSEYE